MSDHLQSNGNNMHIWDAGKSVNQSPSLKQKPESFDEYGMPLMSEGSFPSKRRVTAVAQNVKTRKEALVNALIHVPSVGITLGVLSLTFRNVFWTVPNDSMNTILNTLQFAAQAHGTLIVASLSAIILHLVHIGLASKRGLPLGFISSSFQLNSITYLFRKEFTSLQWRYILVFMLAFALAVLSGPSSAIVMLPRLQFWPIQNHWLGKGNVDFSVYIAASPENLYPQTLTADHIPARCFQANASLDITCPSFGVRHWLINDDFSNVQSGPLPVINKTIEGSWIRYMIAQDSGSYRGIQSNYMASTLANFLGSVLFAFDGGLRHFGQQAPRIIGSSSPGTLQNVKEDKPSARYDLRIRAAGKTIVTRKPIVNVECAGHPADAEELFLLHDQLLWPPWNANPIYSQRWIIDPNMFSSLSSNLNSTVVNASIIDTSRFEGSKPSLGVFFATPEIKTPGSGKCYNCLGDVNPNRNHSLFTCTVDARWISTRAFSDASSGLPAIFDADPSPIAGAFDVDGKKDGHDMPSLYLDSSYSRALTVPWIDNLLNPTPSNRTLLDIIGQRCLDANTRINATLLGKQFEDGLPHRMTTDPMGMLKCLQIGLSIGIAEALSRMQDSIPTYFVAEGHNLPMSRPEYFEPDVLLVKDIYSQMPQGSPKDSTFKKAWIQNLTLNDLNDPTRFTEIYMPAARWGYGYGFHDSVLIYVGTVILLIHTSLSLAYITWILWRGDYKDAGWDTIGGLVSMAMRSGTEEEKMAEEAVPSGWWSKSKERKAIRTRKWAERVAVRELQKDGVGDGREGSKKDGPVLVLRRVGKYEGGKDDVEGDEGGSSETLHKKSSSRN